MSPSDKCCMVCGDKALGYNFNAVTCESCKAFFRRNALSSKEFTCPFNDNCDISVVTRRFCQKCRLDKCFSIGMRKDYIMSEEDKLMKRKKIEQNRAKRKIVPDGDHSTKVKREDGAYNDSSSSSWSGALQNYDTAVCSPADFVSLASMSPTAVSPDSFTGTTTNVRSISPLQDSMPAITSSTIGYSDIHLCNGGINSILNLPSADSSAEEIVTRIVDTPEDASKVINHLMKTPSDAVEIMTKVINSQKDAMRLISHFIASPGDALKIISKIMNSPFDALTVFTKFMSSPTDALEIITKIISSPGEVLQFIQQLMNSPEDALQIMNKFINAPAEALRMINKMVKTNSGEVEVKEMALESIGDEATKLLANSSAMIKSMLDLTDKSGGFPAETSTHLEENADALEQRGKAAKDELREAYWSHMEAECVTEKDTPVEGTEEIASSSVDDGHSTCQTNCDVMKEILEDVEDHPIIPNTIESILCEAIQIEYEGYNNSLSQANSRELNDAERAKLNELIVANKALIELFDVDISLLIFDDLQNTQNQRDPQLLKLINLTAVAIRRLIKMAKKINAFKNMCQEDQVALLKGGCTEMMILRSVFQYDCVHSTWKIPHSQEAMSKLQTKVLKLAKGNVYEEHKKFIETFDPQWRDDENIILIMCAIVLFTATRRNIVHSDVIKLEQNSYYYLLRRYLESIYPGCEAKSCFLKLIKKINELRRLNETIVGVYLNVNPAEVEPLLREIFDMKNQ